MDTPIIDAAMAGVKPGFWEALERAALREQGRRAIWERHYQGHMTYDEFVDQTMQAQLEAERRTGGFSR
jgi:hypothetical protein